MIAAGTRLGPYVIAAPIGSGGMGEVYKATDTRLDRTVAVKVLPEHVASDADLKQRFEREAKTLAALSHPHICPVFDVGSQNGIEFLVMEHLEGETLEQRLKKGALPIDQALQIGIQIADALAAAHRAGIIHRDLKPGNIMLTKSGAKLLDFGLAKTGAHAVAGSLSMLPTTPPNLTAQGAILGTFQYMAPEQLEGLESDARTDIFAFGALLFEMLTGRTAFEGKTRASLLGSILKDDPPPVSRLQPLVPAALNRIIARCLAKDSDDRYQSARDLLHDLKWVASGSSDAAIAQAAPLSGRSNRMPWLVAGVTTTALIAMAAIAFRPTGEVTPAGLVRFTITPPESMSFGGPLAGGTGTAAQIAVSPDGRSIVFVAGAQSAYQIWLRPIGAGAATAIPGTEGGTFPFWSPDSRFIGFFADGKLKKIQIGGGPPIVLADAPSGRGGSWSRDNVILFAPSGATGTRLLRVSSAGGVSTAVTTVDPATGESFHRWPHFLPDGEHFIYTASTGTCCPAAKPSIVKIGSLDMAEAGITLFQAESSVSYASGHLIFAQDDTLMAQPFDPEALQPTGDPFPLAEHISAEGSRYVGASASQNGVLVYGHGDSRLVLGQLTWFDRAGRVTGTVGERAQYDDVALSPDERRVAVTSGPPVPAAAVPADPNRDIWILDAARGVRSRQTFDPGPEGWPVWSPDGTRIAFGRGGFEKGSVRLKLVDGTAADESIVETSGSGVAALSPSDWSADGRFIAYTLTAAFPRGSDVWVVPLFSDRTPFPVAQTEFVESSAVFSPDARWIAYDSTEAGQPNVYVQSFPEANTKYQVSRDGGFYPRWRGDGKELFYVGAEGMMMAVPIDTTSRFEAGEPQVLFQTGAFNNRFFKWAVTRDGKRFLLNAMPPQSSAAPLTVIVNWTTLLEK